MTTPAERKQKRAPTDARCAWRAMNDLQRLTFLEWLKTPQDGQTIQPRIYVTSIPREGAPLRYVSTYDDGGESEPMTRERAEDELRQSLECDYRNKRWGGIRTVDGDEVGVRLGVLLASG